MACLPIASLIGDTRSQSLISLAFGTKQSREKAPQFLSVTSTGSIDRRAVLYSNRAHETSLLKQEAYNVCMTFAAFACACTIHHISFARLASRRRLLHTDTHPICSRCKVSTSKTCNSHAESTSFRNSLVGVVFLL